MQLHRYRRAILRSSNTSSTRNTPHNPISVSSASRNLHSSQTELQRPHPYHAGSRLDLQFISTQTDGRSSLHPLSVQIIKAFEPFTSAVALLVRPQSHAEGKAQGLPAQFIAKINDHRYTAREDIPEWSANFECYIRTAVERALNADPMVDSFASLHGKGPYSKTSEEAWIEEIRLCDFKKRCYENEVAAYHYLRRLQGRFIPCFYGTFRFPFVSRSSDPVHKNGLVASILDYAEGMALEHIDGLNLAEVRPNVDFSRATVERASEETLQIIKRLRDLGVMHGDPRPHNVIIRRQAPHSPVLIDFGLSSIKPADMTVEQYNNLWDPGVDEIADMRFALTNAGVHVESPRPTRVNELCGYQLMNDRVEEHSKEWRERFYDPVPFVEPGYKFVVVDGARWHWEFPRWQLKPGVKRVDDHRYD